MVFSHASGNRVRKPVEYKKLIQRMKHSRSLVYATLAPIRTLLARLIISSTITVLLASALSVTHVTAAQIPLSLSMPFADIPFAGITGSDAVFRNPAALYVNQSLEIRGYHSFAEGDFSGDNAFSVAAGRIGFGYQRIGLDVPAGVSRYDFVVSSRLLKNIYGGGSYTYYKTDWQAIDKAHSWNASLLYHMSRYGAIALKAENLNKHTFFGEESAIGYSASLALRPFEEWLTIGGDFSMYSEQKLRDGTWRLSAFGRVKKGLRAFAGLDNLGNFGFGLEFHFDQTFGGGEVFFDNDADFTRSTVYGGYSVASREQIISKGNRVLHIDFSGTIPEQRTTTFLLADAPETVYERLRRMEKALHDPEIKGLLLTINNPRIGWARLTDFRNACARFRDAGKKVVAYLGSFSGDGAYYLASVADEIYMLPVDALMLNGLSAEVTFYRGTLEKLDIDPQIEKTGPYKTAPNVFTDSAFTDAHREDVNRILDDLFDEYVAAIADGREMDKSGVRRIIDRGPFTSMQAESLKLVDGRFYPYEWEDKIPELFEHNYGIESLPSYEDAPRHRERFGEPPKIAIISVTGGITRGKSGTDFLSGKTAGASTITAAIRKARKDSEVKAIVLRMNTPGGDAVAGDVIWAEAMEARKEKPVIVSMSDVCASGGYYVSAAANQILLQPTTITGSIGVYGGKADLSGFLHKLGMNTEVIKRGEHSNITSWNSSFSTEERNILRRSLNDMYQRFVTVVANGRNLSRDSVYSLAAGRTWAGKSALDVGLADSYGSVLEAVELAREEAGIGEDYQVLEIPERRLFPRLFNLPVPGLRDLFAGEQSGGLVSAIRDLVEPITGLKILARAPYDIEIQ